MFNVEIVGTVNAVAAGWGNSGAGFTHLVIPYIFAGIASYNSKYIAWRLAFWIPAWAQIVAGVCVLAMGQDLPDGQYAELRKSRSITLSLSRSFWTGIRNYRTWLLCVSYGYCFGVELTVDNNLAPYLHDQFDIGLETASVIASLFALSNLFARALGGVASDAATTRFGMRGRLWTLWSLQSFGGLCSIFLYLSRRSLPTTIVVVVLWSVFVPMACGATFGIVPFVSRRSLGVVSGLVGSGGNVGAAITQAIFFTSSSLTIAEGWLWMGVMVLVVTTLTIPFIHFPIQGWGSMFSADRHGSTEEGYYTSDFSESEKAQNLHDVVLNFAAESRSQRGKQSCSTTVQ